ncbi:hypothetical protein D046_0042A, partial [Vibrio parahaemolyticus V-223/04]
MNPNGST